MATPRRPPPRPSRLEYRRSGLGRHRLDLAPRASHRALLVARARLFRRLVHLVRGAGAPDQISARHRLQPERRGVGAGRGQPARHSRPDRCSDISPIGSGANGSGRASCLGFAICFAALIALEHVPTLPLVYVMVLAQGALGYGLTSIMGAVVVEIFQGKHYGSIFGTIMLAALAGGAAGPWVTGAAARSLRQLYAGLCDRDWRQRDCPRSRSGWRRPARSARSPASCTRCSGA